MGVVLYSFWWHACSLLSFSVSKQRTNTSPKLKAYTRQAGSELFVAIILGRVERKFIKLKRTLMKMK